MVARVTNGKPPTPISLIGGASVPKDTMDQIVMVLYASPHGTMKHLSVTSISDRVVRTQDVTGWNLL